MPTKSPVGAKRKAQTGQAAIATPRKNSKVATGRSGGVAIARASARTPPKAAKAATATSKHSQTGAVARNFHEGSRSEILADYLFSAWGTVTPVRRSDDYGVDLACTLTEHIGQRSLVREYYSVQVKSDDAPWVFEGIDSVRWLVDHPLPLFLCRVDKRAGRVQVFHAMHRFNVWSAGRDLQRITMVHGDDPTGQGLRWNEHGQFFLSQPIIEVSMADLIDGQVMARRRDVFSTWLTADRENCDLVRQGVRAFRVPDEYATNEQPLGFSELVQVPELDAMVRGIARLVDASDSIGAQLLVQGDRETALLALFLVDRLRVRYPDARPEFLRELRVPGRLKAVAQALKRARLNLALGESDTPALLSALDAVKHQLLAIPLIAEYLRA